MAAVLKEPRKYRLLGGEHVQNVHPEQVGANGLPITEKFSRGDVFDSYTDLEERLNSKDPACEKKVERVYPNDNWVTNPPRWQDDPWMKRPDETPQEFARRVALLAEQQPDISPGHSSPDVPMQHGHGTPASSEPRPDPTTGVNLMATFEGFTVKELLAHAEAEELDLRGARTKEEILKVFRAAYS